MIPWCFLEKVLLKISENFQEKDHSEILFYVELKSVGLHY